MKVKYSIKAIDKSRYPAFVKLLKEARRLISYGEEEFVCLALTEALERDVGTVVDKFLLVELIAYRLGKHATVTDWLRNEHGIDTDSRSSAAREYRLRWIDSMIEEFGGNPGQP